MHDKESWGLSSVVSIILWYVQEQWRYWYSFPVIEQLEVTFQTTIESFQLMGRRLYDIIIKWMLNLMMAKNPCIKKRLESIPMST